MNQKLREQLRREDQIFWGGAATIFMFCFGPILALGIMALLESCGAL